MESARKNNDRQKVEEKRQIAFNDPVLIEILEDFLIECQDSYKSKMENPPKGDFHNEAMNLFVAKGACIALESFKQKLKSYVKES